MNRNAITMVEICVVALITALLAGGLFMMISNTGKQNQLLDQRLHFNSSAQVLFDALKNDLRSLKKIIVVPEMVEIAKVTDFNSDGEELLETVIYKITDRTVTRSQGSKHNLYQLINDGMKRLGQTMTGTFSLDNLENSDDYTTGTLLTCFSVKDSSGRPVTGFEATMSVDIRWLNQPVD